MPPEVIMHLSHTRSTVRFLPLALSFAVGCSSDGSPAEPVATRVAITFQPSAAETGKTIQPAVMVELQDALGNVVERDVPHVSISLLAPSGGATLIGTTTIQANNGVATFDDIGVDVAGIGYRLIATAEAMTATSEPFSVTPAAPLVAVSAGESHSCGLTAAGAVYCWGTQKWVTAVGQSATELARPAFSMRQRATPEVAVSGDVPGVGRFDPTRRTLPSLLASATDFTVVESGITHSCGLSLSGAAHCWGINYVGELGDGTQQGTHVPTPVSGDLHFSTLALGPLQTCGVTTAGAVYCWGLKTGLLGNENGFTQTPTPVPGGLTFTSLDISYDHSCGLADGAAYCWGGNNRGQLGDGTKTSRSAPTRVATEVSFTSVKAGGAHACALTATGVAYCWGYNAEGAVGDGTTTDRLAPVPVATDLRFVELTAGGLHTCGVTTAGTAYCWGDNSEGALGDGTTFDRSLPVAVAGDATFSMLRAGTWHTCGVKTGGGALCWGKNGDGQLGDGTRTRRLIPTAVR
jgi:alpha-tubulin suppressor-like RCC1 family protein